MTMYFRDIRDAITSLLLASASGQYRVRGYPDQNLSAEEIEDTDRLVQVYYTSGEFPQSSSGRGPFDHRMTFRVQLIVSKAASCDLSVLNSDLATPSQIAAALAAAEPAAQGADESLDELIDLVFQVLMSGPNIHLGLDYPIGSRWIERVEKQEPFARSDRAVAMATMDLTCRVAEAAPSATIYDLDIVQVDVTHQGDDTVRASVEVDNGD